MTVRVMLVAAAPGAAQRQARFGDGAAARTGTRGGAPAGLDEEGRRAAREAAGRLPTGPFAVYTAPSARCRETAEELGLSPEPETDPELADLDAGRWHGRTLEEVAAAEPDALRSWLAEPAAAPHGGESVIDVVVRIGAWLDACAAAGAPRGAAGSAAAGRAAVGGRGRATGAGPAAASGPAAERDAASPSAPPAGGAGGGARILAVVEPAVVRAALVHGLGLPAQVFWRLDVAPLSVTELSGRSRRWNLSVGRPL